MVKGATKTEVTEEPKALDKRVDRLNYEALKVQVDRLEAVVAEMLARHEAGGLSVAHAGTLRAKLKDS